MPKTKRGRVPNAREKQAAESVIAERNIVLNSQQENKGNEVAVSIAKRRKAAPKKSVPDEANPKK